MIIVILTDRLTNMKSKPCKKDRQVLPDKEITKVPLPLKDLFDKLDEIKNALEDDENKLRGTIIKLRTQN